MAARTKIPVKVTGRSQAVSAIAFTAADATNNMAFDNTTHDVLLLIQNTHSSEHVVTIKRSATVDGVVLSDLQLTVAAGTTAVVGPFPATYYNKNDVGVGLSGLPNAVFVDPPATPTALSFAVILAGA